MKYWYKTIIDFEFKKDWVFPETSLTEPAWWTTTPENVVSKDFMESMRLLGLPMAKLSIFYCPPFCSPTDAHIDISKDNNLQARTVGFNYAIGGSDSKMVWYKPLTPHHSTGLSESNKVQGKWPKYLIHWPIVPEELQEEESVTITGKHLTMVRVDVPHALFTGNEPRWCISLRCQNPTKAMPSWDEFVAEMRQKQLLDE